MASKYSETGVAGITGAGDNIRFRQLVQDLQEGC